ncbi:hypothetical protein [Shewanella maritima]|uniref:hypothetical protein n=1 Tax=Shewanella maritima TaxID=2520507 RepID=UPI003736C4DD
MKFKQLLKPWFVLLVFAMSVQIPVLVQLSPSLGMVAKKVEYIDYTLQGSETIPHLHCADVGQAVQNCMYEPNFLPLTLWIFILPLFPLTIKMIYQVLKLPRLPRPRAIAH